MQQRSCSAQQTGLSPSPRYSFRLFLLGTAAQLMLPMRHLSMMPYRIVQLDAIKVERGLKDSDGPGAPLKPLVEVLREAKEAKEEAFQAVWRSMKTGEQDRTIIACSQTLQDMLRSRSGPNRTVPLPNSWCHCFKQLCC